MFELIYPYTISITGIPIQWIPKIEIYYPDLPQFPIMYIHTFCNEQRVIGCPVCVSYKLDDKDTCEATFTVLANVPFSQEIFDCLKNELENRIGFSNKITIDTIVCCCNSNINYIQLFKALWRFIKSSYGNSIPYGRFYEEVYSIPRFVAAWQPKTGRQSEMRMLYNFMSAFGEEVRFPDSWKHLEFYVIPNYTDALQEDYFYFQKFQKLYNAMKKVFDNTFSNTATIDRVNFKVLPKAWPQNKEDFINQVTGPLFNSETIDSDEKYMIELLVDAFNRHGWRAAYFISSYMTITHFDYRNWSKAFFSNLYDNGWMLKGYSEKVIACFLQQGFGKEEIIPIDTWISTFYEFPLGISDKHEFYNSFSGLGKLERVIWLASQSNKTNMRDFFDILWCQRYGTIGNGELRGINPVACSECLLKNDCAGLNKNLAKFVLLIDISKDFQKNPEILPDVTQVDYICECDNSIPKKVYVKRSHKRPKREEWVLVDEFSGYILTDKNKLKDSLIKKEIITVKEFINN